MSTSRYRCVTWPGSQRVEVVHLVVRWVSVLEQSAGTGVVALRLRSCFRCWSAPLYRCDSTHGMDCMRELLKMVTLPIAFPQRRLKYFKADLNAWLEPGCYSKDALNAADSRDSFKLGSLALGSTALSRRQDE